MWIISIDDTLYIGQFGYTYVSSSFCRNQEKKKKRINIRRVVTLAHVEWCAGMVEMIRRIQMDYIFA